ncbi:MAG: anthranilate synthase component I family protein [Ferruginibacter sp.]|nr:anthranilate synthase component I family protein [Ferruginibacter sp.]
MLNWAQPFNIFCWLDNSQYHFESPAFECLLAVGCKRKIETAAGKTFESLKQFCEVDKEWIFGHLGYDLKNETEQLRSLNFDGVNFPDCHFFVPEMVLQLNESGLTVYCEENAEEIFEAIESRDSTIEQKRSAPLSIKNRISPQDYASIVKKLQQHILRGDCYEVNFCQEFFAEDAIIDPLSVYCSLITLSPNPFAALYKLNGRFCICASPERYFKIAGGKIYAQPIKGTAKRNLESHELDELSRQQLLSSEKEKTENVMIVDLVRNDLSRVCKQGTVRVEELFGIYSFPQVHQMISTISGELENNTDWIDVVKATFPMGSMTGAPKKRVMEIIERYEHTKRGLFSGAIGYVNPQGDADFNVVIRSVLYNTANKYISFQAGSAITFYSDAEEEYQECLLKAATMKQVLEQG